LPFDPSVGRVTACPMRVIRNLPVGGYSREPASENTSRRCGGAARSESAVILGWPDAWPAEYYEKLAEQPGVEVYGAQIHRLSNTRGAGLKL